MTSTLFNTNRFNGTNINLDGDDFIYTDTIESGNWGIGAVTEYVLESGNSSIALTAIVLQSDQTYRFELYEGTEYTQGSGQQIIPLRMNRNKVGKPLSMKDAEKEPTISDLGTKIWTKNIFLQDSYRGADLASISLDLGLILRPETAYALVVTNTGGSPGTMEFDLRFATISKGGAVTTPSLLPASI
jgi:hypothetical protein